MAELLGASLNKLTTGCDENGMKSGEVLAKHGIFELDLVLAWSARYRTLPYVSPRHCTVADTENTAVSEVIAADALCRCPAITRFVTEYGPAMVARLNAVCPALRLTAVDTIKVQLNEGTGGCFPMHYDTNRCNAYFLPPIPCGIVLPLTDRCSSVPSQIAQ
jgi:hypothetical protein